MKESYLIEINPNDLPNDFLFKDGKLYVIAAALQFTNGSLEVEADGNTAVISPDGAFNINLNNKSYVFKPSADGIVVFETRHGGQTELKQDDAD